MGIACLAWFGVGTSHAGTIHVPGEVSTILAALDQAVSGDSVLVAPGTYTAIDDRYVQLCANLLLRRSCGFLKPGVNLIGTGGPGVTSIDTGPDEGVVRFTLLASTVPGSEPILVQGFTITGGLNGIMAGCLDGQLTVRDCWLMNNDAKGMSFDYVDVTIEDCVVEGNGSISDTGSLGRGLGSNIVVRDTRFANNLAAGLFVQDAVSLLVEDCEFLDHKGVRASHLRSCNDVTIRRCLFAGNTQTFAATASGAAIYLDTSQGTIEQCIFVNDSSFVSHGGAIATRGASSSVTVENSTFVGCYATGLGAALAGGGAVTFRRNIVVDCDGLSAVSSSLETPVTDCCLYWSNAQNFYENRWAPSPTDLFVDPLFCDPATYDFTLESGSPCLPEHSNGCGLIGAYGQGCGTVSVTPLSWGSLKNAYRGGTVR